MGKGGNRETRQEAAAAVQVRADDGPEQGSGSAGSCKWSDSEYVLKVESIGFLDRWRPPE